MVEIYSKSLARAIAITYYSWKLTRTPNKYHKGDGKWPLFVSEQLFWWSASITLGNNNDRLSAILPTSPHTSVGLPGCISIVFSQFFNILTNLTTMLPVGSL